jgi:YHS domain-containing protein
MSKRIAISALVLALGLLTVASAAVAGEAITKVEAKKVCMVNDALFQKDQIPVEVEGRTYYGCCQMCKKRLAEDAAIRASVDPVSGEPVDKAAAVIGALEDGSVLYFENEENFEAYQTGEAKPHEHEHGEHHDEHGEHSGDHPHGGEKGQG